MKKIRFRDVVAIIDISLKYIYNPHAGGTVRIKDHSLRLIYKKELGKHFVGLGRA